MQSVTRDYVFAKPGPGGLPGIVLVAAKTVKRDGRQPARSRLWCAVETRGRWIPGQARDDKEPCELSTYIGQPPAVGDFPSPPASPGCKIRQWTVSANPD